MKFNKSDFFSCGEFAKLMEIGKDTLFHYDKLGIFLPEYIDENNYRYYSANQIEIFEVINILKELGMSLKQIKEYLDNKNPKNFISLLEKQEKEINKKIEELKKMKEFVENKRKSIENFLEKKIDVVSIEECPEEYCIYTNIEDVKNEKSLLSYVAKHINYCKENKLYSSHSIGESIDLKSVKEKNYFAYNFFYTKIQEKSKIENIHIKKSGKYLVYYHTKGFYTLESVYKEIIKYIENNNLKVEEKFYEDIILDELAVKGYENYHMKISIKII